MTPAQVFTVAAIGGTAGVLGALALAALSYGLGILACRTYDHLFEKRQQQLDRRAQQARRAEQDPPQQASSADLDTCHAIHALPAHDPRDPR